MLRAWLIRSEKGWDKHSELLLLAAAAAAEGLRASLREESTQEPMTVRDTHTHPIVEMETAAERALCWGAI